MKTNCGSSPDSITDLDNAFLRRNSNRPIKGGLRKIRDYTKEELCLDSAHNPPSMIVLSPGLYEYTCPGCGKTTTFTVPAISY